MVVFAADVKPLAILTFLLLAAASAIAQVQERKLLERINKPDLSLGNPFEKQAFKGASIMPMRTAPTTEKQFFGAKGANVKEFPLTHSFLGVKNPWLGHQVFDTKNASSWSKSVVMDADKKVPIRKAESIASSDAAKSAHLGSPVVPVRPFVPVPSSQGALSQITDKITNKMTIDEVRDILNKSR